MWEEDDTKRIGRDFMCMLSNHRPRSIVDTLIKQCVLHTTLRQKWGGGSGSNTGFVLCIHLPGSSSRVNNHDDCCGFL